MYLASKLNSDRDTLHTLCKTLKLGRNTPDNVIRDVNNPLAGKPAPQIVQLAGNDVQQLVEAARKVAPFADAIDLNLGCPQKHAEEGHYGAYLLPKQNWPLLAEIVSSLAQAVDVPITTKIRLTVPKEQTPELAVVLARAGSSLVTVHPRFASSVRRRKGLADLDQVIRVREALQVEGLLRSGDRPHGDTAVVSNGNVRCWSDVVTNLSLTGASGVMVGETLLENPALFRPSLPEAYEDGHFWERSSRAMAEEYIDLRYQYDAFETPFKVVRQHLQSILCSIPHNIDPEALAEQHRYAADTKRVIAAIRTEQALAKFRYC
ncbi:tRNA-dihydrouridine synthase [Kalmanozyma brasiliensis GHG001]|uniref:tRNA-dihydrouridine(16/17) synthase [NAD(P)(+)] n=1 Tax=Kalmanozyma brasiliensis (strain GHG001) TaxID=1365824 RepID=V5F0E7_KALBG|nr:tRNA-dihydrouridine synthase [Kalmanozyma brasiliensis GHG001]EST09768.1 tRNA-dihydrouridine synthase [Kalmanozyma brasiliensis GHG001]